MQTLTTKEAWELSSALFTQGKSIREVQRTLTQNGYISWRTKKPLALSSIKAMKYRLERGYMPTTDRSVHVTNKYYAKNSITPAATVTRSVSVARPTKWDLVKQIDEATYLSEETRQAVIEVIVRDKKNVANTATNTAQA